ncbi:MAG: DUF1080 domain-containing protein [Opitutus sp.]|nr:DUF1080 domain-containing protein [Opitutus sp.]
MKIPSVFFFVAAGMGVTALAQPGALFNGRDLTGWVQHGGTANFRVEGGEIVGTAVLNTANSFLCTTRDFGDFVLEYDFKVDPRLNSGVQIRSQVYDVPTSLDWQGEKISIPAGRVHGYQVEIDPDPVRARWWTAGLYDEARRKWLYPGSAGGDEKAFTKLSGSLFKPGEWNHIRVEARGASLKTWLNGTLCADIVDAVTPRGFIALQVHEISDAALAGAEVRWRNLQLTELPATLNTLTPEEVAAGWRLLWDGKTTEGWRSAKVENTEFPAKGWKIEDGVLSVLPNGGKEAVGGGDIVTREQYSEFELCADFRVTPGANSGIKYLVQLNLAPVNEKGEKAATGSSIGPEFQIIDDALHADAKLGRDGNRTLGSLYDLIPAAATKRPASVGEWNTARIVVKGARVEHWLNGQQILVYERGSPAFRELVALSKFKFIPGFGEWPAGHILLQDHGDAVSYRNVRIRDPK